MAKQDDQPEVGRSDQSLLRRYRDGDEDAATVLFARYADRLEGLARSQISDVLTGRLDPQDIVQSVFRSFFRRAGEGSYDAPEGGQLWGLLLIMALHKVRSLGAFHRAQKRDAARTTSDEIAVQPEYGDEQAFNDLQLCVTEIMSSLPSIDCTIVELRIEGFQVSDIAEKTNRSKRTVERVLQNFRARLEQEIEDVDAN